MAKNPPAWAVWPKDSDPRTYAEIAGYDYSSRTPEIDSWIEDYQK